MTSKEFILKNFKGDINDLKNLLAANKMEAEIEDPWDIVEAEIKVVTYDAKKFIDDARKYQAEKNFIQTSAKLWLAAVYAVKKFFLEIDTPGYWITSHDGIKYFAKLGYNFHSDIDEMGTIWRNAEKLHKYSYGENLWTNKQITDLINDVEWFVDEFAKLPKDKVKTEVEKIQNGAEIKFDRKTIAINFDEKTKKVKFSGMDYTVKKTFY